MKCKTKLLTIILLSLSAMTCFRGNTPSHILMGLQLSFRFFQENKLLSYPWRLRNKPFKFSSRFDSGSFNLFIGYIFSLLISMFIFLFEWVSKIKAQKASPSLLSI